MPVLKVKKGADWIVLSELPLDKVPTTVSFDAVTAKEFRLEFHPVVNDSDNIATQGSAPGSIGFDFPIIEPKSIVISDFRLFSVEKVNRYEQKAGFSINDDYYSLERAISSKQEYHADQQRAVSVNSVVDLTGLMQPDGTLSWQPPSGKWKVLRFGFSLLGTENHPAPAEATGLEVDKYDADAVFKYLENYLSLFEKAVGKPLNVSGIDALLSDSIESGASNWTPRMGEHFSRLRGYDLTPWLPVLTGVIIGSREESDKFLFDFRRTLSDLLAEQHYKTISDFAKSYGLKVYGEALEDNRPSLGDDMSMRRHADIPMAAYWAHSPDKLPRATYIADMKGASSVAHIYGKSVAAAESLTSIGYPWAMTPEDLKPLVDNIFLHGINRPVIHSSVHQPVDDYLPGMSMMSIGQFFNRLVTWADMAKPWMSYLSRSSYLLQHGRNVADVLYFYGEEAPLTALFSGGRIKNLPELFNYDFANSDVLLNDLYVDKGELVSAGGARYKALYLGGTSARMTAQVLAKVVQFVEGGATVVGDFPQSSPSLSDDIDDYNRLLNKLRSLCRENYSPRHSLGKFIKDNDIDRVMTSLGVLPDFGVEGEQKDSGIQFVYRKSAEADVFFIRNNSAVASSFEGRFSVTGKSPEVWRADTGEVNPIKYREKLGVTIVPFQMESKESLFIVFRKAAAQETIKSHHKDSVSLLMELNGAWRVELENPRGVSPPIVLDNLSSLSDHDDLSVKYFSGVAHYQKNIEFHRNLKAEEEIYIDLGSVADIAEVFINGQPVGVLWKHPYRLKITSKLKVGNNTIEINVANLWANRLIGDANSDTEKVTTIQMPTYHSSAPLRQSGLLGPVKLLVAK